MYKSRYKKRPSKILGLFPFLVISLFLFFGFIFFLRSDFLKIKQVSVETGSLVSEDRVRELATGFMSGSKLLFVPKANIFFFDSQDLEKKIASEFGGVESVDVDRQIFSFGIDIKIKERGALFAFCNKSEAGEECFNMSRDGFVFEEEGADINLDGKIVFYSQRNETVLRSFFDTKERVENYMKFIDSIRARNINISSVTIESFDESFLSTDVGRVVFNPSDDPYAAAQNASLLIEDIRKQNPEAKFEYIDTRFGNKMFYKLAN